MFQEALAHRLEPMPQHASAVESPEAINSVRLFGLEIENTTLGNAATWLVAQACKGTPATIGFINAHCVNVLHRAETYFSVLGNFDRLYADGSGMRIAAKVWGTPLSDNVNGTDLFPVLCREAAQKNVSMFFLGGQDGVASTCANRMTSTVDGLNVAGSHVGFFANDDEEDWAIARINASGAGILFVGMGVPLQEEWVARNRHRITVPVILAVGGLFDYYSGRIARAPRAIRKIGCEWAWRLAMEPRRLARRYLLGNAEFLLRLAAKRVAEVASVFGPDLLMPGMQRRVAVYGATDESQLTFQKIAQGGDAIRFVGLYDDRGLKSRHKLFGVPVSGSSNDLVERARRGEIDDVVVVLPDQAKARTAAIVRRFENLPVDVYVELDNPADLDDAVDARFKLGWRNNMTLKRVQARPMREWGQLFKGLIDRVTTAVLLGLLLPVFAMIALAIKLDSAGPVFFRQRRHGLGGRTITIWKFRTMRVAEDGDTVQQARRDDDRITRIGRWLRKTSLDELPQLINVFRGDMSLVGPRPHAIAHNDYYGERIEGYDRRNLVKPGISGWAQVCGHRGETPDISSMAQRIDHDLWYIQNWSPLLDLRILVLTPIYGFVHKNAY